MNPSEFNPYHPPEDCREQPADLGLSEHPLWARYHSERKALAGSSFLIAFAGGCWAATIFINGFTPNNAWLAAATAAVAAAFLSVGILIASDHPPAFRIFTYLAYLLLPLHVAAWLAMASGQAILVLTGGATFIVILQAHCLTGYARQLEVLRTQRAPQKSRQD